MFGLLAAQAPVNATKLNFTPPVAECPTGNPFSGPSLPYNALPNPNISSANITVYWNEIEGAGDDIYDWSVIDDKLNGPAALGNFVNLTIISDNGTDRLAPSWVYDKVETVMIPCGFVDLTLTNYNDPDYIAAAADFITDFNARYLDNKRIPCVKIQFLGTNSIIQDDDFTPIDPPKPDDLGTPPPGGPGDGPVLPPPPGGGPVLPPPPGGPTGPIPTCDVPEEFQITDDTLATIRALADPCNCCCLPQPTPLGPPVPDGYCFQLTEVIRPQHLADRVWFTVKGKNIGDAKLCADYDFELAILDPLVRNVPHIKSDINDFTLEDAAEIREFPFDNSHIHFSGSEPSGATVQVEAKRNTPYLLNFEYMADATRPYQLFVDGEPVNEPLIFPKNVNSYGEFNWSSVRVAVPLTKGHHDIKIAPILDGSDCSFVIRCFEFAIGAEDCLRDLIPVNINAEEICPGEEFTIQVDWDTVSKRSGDYVLALRLVYKGSTTQPDDCWQSLRERNAQIAFANDLVVMDSYWGVDNVLRGGYILLEDLGGGGTTTVMNGGSGGGGGTVGSGATGSMDIGNVNLAGGTTADVDGTSFTLTGSGADIWGNADSFHFEGQNDNSNTVQQIARIDALTATHQWAKAGVQYRDNDRADEKNVGVYVRPDGQVIMQWRAVRGQASAHAPLVGGTGLPKWVKLDKNGNDYTGYWSLDGITWNEIRTITINMGSNNLTGMALTSHDNDQLATAQFANYYVGDNPPVPTPDTPDPDPNALAEFRYDFGDDRFEVADGFTLFEKEQTSGVIRWDSSATLGSTSHSGGQMNDAFTRSFIYGRAARTLSHDVANGTWQVELTFADQHANENMTVAAEGLMMDSDIDVGAYEKKIVSFDVEVDDGVLDIELGDNDDTKLWTVSGMVLRQLAEAPAADAFEMKIDFGPPGAPVAAGWIGITEDHRSGPIRWTKWGYADPDRGPNRTGSSDLHRDLVFSRHDRDFIVEVENGDYEVSVILGDIQYRHDDYSVSVEGVEIGRVTTDKNYETVTADTTVTDGELTFSFEDHGGSDQNWAVIGLTLKRK